MNLGRGRLVSGLQGFLFPLCALYRLYLGPQALAQPRFPNVSGGLPLFIDLRVGRGERRPAFVQDHDPVALLDLGAQALEAMGAVIPVIVVAGVLFLDAGFPGVAQSPNPAIVRLRLLEPTDGVPWSGDLGKFGLAQGFEGF